MGLANKSSSADFRSILIWNIELVRWFLLEALETAPSHVLDGGQAAFGEEEEIKVTVCNNGVVCSLNDTGKWAI